MGEGGGAVDVLRKQFIIIAPCVRTHRDVAVLRVKGKVGDVGVAGDCEAARRGPR